jgi:regulator of sigma E protease
MPGTPAQAAGFKVGDTIVDINGRHIGSFDDVVATVAMRPGEPLNVTVERAGKDVLLHVTPRLAIIKDPFGETERLGQLGILGVKPQIVHLGFFGAISEAGHTTWLIVQTTLDMASRIFAGTSAVSQLHGPLGIAKLSAQVAQISLLSLIKFAAFISVSIGLVNLFPIPLLDGGHLLYYGFEAVLGRPLGARAQDVGFRLGLAVMLGLMLLATWNDLVRLKLF